MQRNLLAPLENLSDLEASEQLNQQDNNLQSKNVNKNKRKYVMDDEQKRKHANREKNRREKMKEYYLQLEKTCQFLKSQNEELVIQLQQKEEMLKNSALHIGALQTELIATRQEKNALQAQLSEVTSSGAVNSSSSEPSVESENKAISEFSPDELFNAFFGVSDVQQKDVPVNFVDANTISGRIFDDQQSTQISPPTTPPGFSQFGMFGNFEVYLNQDQNLNPSINLNPDDKLRF